MAAPRQATLNTTEDGRSADSDLSGPRPLSCKSCRVRKVKCNKVKPCGPCQRSGLDCVFPSRQRHSRTKQAASARSGELYDRIGRLENLVEKFGGEDALLEDQSRRNPTISTLHDTSLLKKKEAIIEAGDNAASAATKLDAGPYFWSCLVEEVEGLKQLLEQEDEPYDDFDASTSPAGSSEMSNLQPSTFVFGGPRMPLAHPPMGQAVIFFNIYFYNVDPLFKVLHKPTLMSLLPKATDFAASPPKSGALPALFASMYFAAVTSLSSVDCMKLFRQPRDELLACYKDCTERALADANFLNGTEIVSLQAFVIYLLCLRCQRRDRTSWALIGLAIRLAHALNLHRDGQGLSFSLYDAEMRRRLWWQIVILDDRGAQEHATDPMIMPNFFDTEMPSNVNDLDFDALSERPLVERKGSSDVIFSRLVFDASHVIRRLRFFPPTDLTSGSGKALEEMENEIKLETRRIESLYTFNGDTADPLLRLTVSAGMVVTSKLWLYFWYPLRHQLARSRNIPRDLVLEKAALVLELNAYIEAEPSLQHFGWFTNTFIQWHPLAVALAELCLQPLGPLANRAWAIIDKIYVTWGDRYSDTRDGELWRPIRILYKKARLVRQNYEKAARDPQVVRPPSETSLEPAMQNIDIAGMTSLHPISQIGFAPLQQSNIERDQTVYDPNLEWGSSLQPNTNARGEMYYPMDWDVWNEFVLNADLIGAQTHADTHTDWPNVT